VSERKGGLVDPAEIASPPNGGKLSPGRSVGRPSTRLVLVSARPDKGMKHAACVAAESDAKV
jgi:hypothetical protein